MLTFRHIAFSTFYAFTPPPLFHFADYFIDFVIITLFSLRHADFRWLPIDFHFAILLILMISRYCHYFRHYALAFMFFQAIFISYYALIDYIFSYCWYYYFAAMMISPLLIISAALHIFSILILLLMYGKDCEATVTVPSELILFTIFRWYWYVIIVHIFDADTFFIFIINFDFHAAAVPFHFFSLQEDIAAIFDARCSPLLRRRFHYARHCRIILLICCAVLLMPLRRRRSWRPLSRYAPWCQFYEIFRLFRFSPFIFISLFFFDFHFAAYALTFSDSFSADARYAHSFRFHFRCFVLW